MLAKNYAHASDRGIHQEDLFRELAAAYARFASEAGVDLVAYRDPELPLFSQKSFSEQQEILNALGICVKICEHMKGQGKELFNSASLVWSACKEFGVRPPSDFFSKIGPDSVIEVHSREGVQIFRNFNFYRYCSYSIEELYSQSWNNLYTRDLSIVDSMKGFLGQIYDGTVQSTVAPPVPSYRATELHSARRYEVEVSWDWGAPLFDLKTSDPVASIAIETAKVISSSLLSAQSVTPLTAALSSAQDS